MREYCYKHHDPDGPFPYEHHGEPWSGSILSMKDTYAFICADHAQKEWGTAPPPGGAQVPGQGVSGGLAKFCHLQRNGVGPEFSTATSRRHHVLFRVLAEVGEMSTTSTTSSTRTNGTVVPATEQSVWDEQWAANRSMPMRRRSALYFLGADTGLHHGAQVGGSGTVMPLYAESCKFPPSREAGGYDQVWVDSFVGEGWLADPRLVEFSHQHVRTGGRARVWGGGGSRCSGGALEVRKSGQRSRISNGKIYFDLRKNGRGGAVEIDSICPKQPTFQPIPVS